MNLLASQKIGWHKKSCVQETLNLSTNADSKTDTKTVRNEQKKTIFLVVVNPFFLLEVHKTVL